MEGQFLDSDELQVEHHDHEEEEPQGSSEDNHPEWLGDAADEGDLAASIVLLGEDADLSSLRNVDTREIGLRQRIGYYSPPNMDTSKFSQQSPVLLTFLPCHATLVRGTATSEDDDNDDDGNMFRNIPGHVVCTTRQVMFVSDVSSTDYDILIGAGCITLHALTEEEGNQEDAANVRSVYLQIQPSKNYEDGMEFTICPTSLELSEVGRNVSISNDNHENLDSAQVLFHALCKLISLNPVVDTETNDDEYYYPQDDFYYGENDNIDEDLIWEPKSTEAPFLRQEDPTVVSSHGITGRTAAFPDYENYDEGGGSGASEEERNAMLEHLDRLLVVRNEFQIQDGQFDDATEG